MCLYLQCKSIVMNSLWLAIVLGKEEVFIFLEKIASKIQKLINFNDYKNIKVWYSDDALEK